MTKQEWRALGFIIVFVGGSVWLSQRADRPPGQGQAVESWAKASPVGSGKGRESQKGQGEVATQMAPGQLKLWPVGRWNGYEVAWVNDHDIASKRRGFYVFKKSEQAKGKNDFEELRRVGEIGPDTLFFVRDRHMGSRAPGFYALGRGGELRPMTSFGAINSGSKREQSQGAALLDEPSAPSDEQLSELGERELLDLAQRASRMAEKARQASQNAQRKGG